MTVYINSWLKIACVIGLAACDAPKSDTKRAERANPFQGISQPLQPLLCTPVETKSQTNDAPFMQDHMKRTLRIQSTDQKTLQIVTSVPGKADVVELHRISGEQNGLIYSSNSRRVGSRLNLHEIVIERPDADGKSTATEQIIQWNNSDTRENGWWFDCVASS